MVFYSYWAAPIKILPKDTAEQPAAIKTDKTVSKSFDFQFFDFHYFYITSLVLPLCQSRITLAHGLPQP